MQVNIVDMDLLSARPVIKKYLEEKQCSDFQGLTTTCNNANETF